MGTAVGRVKAEDSDVGENTDMTYHLKAESGSGGDAFKVTTDSDTQEAIIVVQKVRLPGCGKGGQGQQVWEAPEQSDIPTSPTAGIEALGTPRTNLGKHRCYHFTQFTIAVLQMRKGRHREATCLS